MRLRKYHLTMFGCYLLISGALFGCAPGERPLQMVQMCLHNHGGLLEFKQEMQSIARMEGMKFVDNSELAQRNLEAVTNEVSDASTAGPVIDLHIDGPDGIGVSAGDLDGPGYQVALGFSEGSNPLEARKFADRVIDRLKRRWNVSAVPADEGALPRRDC